MATIPKPIPGLIFRYGYLRVHQYEAGETVGKERPCCVLIPLKSGQIIHGHPIHVEEKQSTASQHVSDDGEVLILLIQSDLPNSDQIGLEMTEQEKKYVGLPSHAPSYIIVSEVNIDRWPNSDMSLVPGNSNSFVYPRTLSGPFLSRVATAFRHVQKASKLQMLLRHP
jgi:hypothetical protein